VSGAPVDLDDGRGLDHGCWSVLTAMYPEADVPVVQLSLDTTRPASFHLALAGELAPLRDQEVLVLASGNMVHNLGVIDFRNPDGYDWAVRVNGELKRRIVARDHAGLADYRSLGPDARLAVPTPEHYLPLLYALALRTADDDLAFFNDKTVLGSIAMTSLVLGGAAGRS
jgi:4,5-DOPA dioxygenase extradiol